MLVWIACLKEIETQHTTNENHSCIIWTQCKIGILLCLHFSSQSLWDENLWSKISSPATTNEVCVNACGVHRLISIHRLPISVQSKHFPFRVVYIQTNTHTQQPTCTCTHYLARFTHNLGFQSPYWLWISSGCSFSQLCSHISWLKWLAVWMKTENGLSSSADAICAGLRCENTALQGPTHRFNKPLLLDAWFCICGYHPRSSV